MGAWGAFCTPAVNGGLWEGMPCARNGIGNAAIIEQAAAGMTMVGPGVPMDRCGAGMHPVDGNPFKGGIDPAHQ